ncbi:MAG: Gfo/Idh/MocA family protein [Actinomycetes bacterium]
MTGDGGPPEHRPLRLGVVGAGRFARFLAAAVADLPGVALAAVADSHRQAAEAFAAELGCHAVSDWPDLLTGDLIDVVVVATPPHTHGEIVRAAIDARLHVFCEKPLATSAAEAAALVGAADEAGVVVVVDHVLRYNPIVAVLLRLRGDLLPPAQRLSFENDASDEDLPPGHWFWDEAASGGIFVEHGVHFFDLGSLLLGSQPSSVTAMTAARPHGPVDTASATCLHPDGVVATYTHAFSHPRRCERQLLRVDHGTALVAVHGWIPVEATIDAWVDDQGADLADGLRDRAAELFAVSDHRLPGGADIESRVSRHVDAGGALGRGRPHDIPHLARVQLTLGGPTAKAHVYAESVRAAMGDLVRTVRTSTPPRSGAAEGAAAVYVAAAAREAARTGTSTRVELPVNRHHRPTLRRPERTP